MSSTSSSTAASRGPRDRRLVDVWDALRSPDVRVVSTDVFDTLVWRQVPEPVDAFPLIGERLLHFGQLSPALSPEGFGRLRRTAEDRARRLRQLRVEQSEVRLEEIYELIPDWVFLSSSREAAVATELEIERELLVPDLDVVDLLAEAKANGKTVVAVSDIYFSEGQLLQLLDQPVLSEVEFDRVFTSSDHRTNKSGGLFEIVLRALHVHPGQCIHLGDNREADVVFPGRLGIGTFHFERRPEPFATIADGEARFMPASSDSPGHARLVSGLTATRTKVLSRSEAAEIPGSLRPFWDYGATVLGPAFTGFAEWVHDHCRRTGARRVGCLMREGAFLEQILRRSSAYLDADLDPQPLWLNRDLCTRASIAEGSSEELHRLLARRSALSVGSFCRLLGVSLASLPQWTSHAATSLEDPVVRHNLVESLSLDERVRADLVQRSRALRERVVAYIDGFSDEAALTIVDLGWGASIQGHLTRVLSQAGAERPTVGLYMLTHEAAAEQVVHGIEAHGFLGEYGFPDAMVKTVMRSPEVLEQVCMPPHGSQLDLDDRLEPVIGPANLPALQLVEAETVRKGVLAYQREWARYQTALPAKVAPLSAARHLLRPIVLRSVAAPTPSEAAAFGGWRHDEGQGSTRTDVIADQRVVERLRYMSPQQARDLPMSELYWPFGVAALVDEHWPALMTAAAAGELPWEALAAPLETGAFEIRGRGVDVDADSAVRVVPSRNRFGLSAVTGTIRAPHLQHLVLGLSQEPAVLRMDWIELRCHVQGCEEPVLTRFDRPEELRRFEHANCFVLNPNVYIAHGHDATLTLDLATVARGVVFRVDVECGFAVIPISPVLPAGGRFANLEEAERQLSALQQSKSWRWTAPLRTVKRRMS